MNMKVHELKCWPDFYEALVNDFKTFEVRKNDRDFQVDDTLHLREWNPANRAYTGRELLAVVLYVMDLADPFLIARGYVVMSVEVFHEKDLY
jgi:hypothetical protein